VKNYLLLNLSDLAAKRAINMRDEALLWDILARDLKREAGRLEEKPDRVAVRVAPIVPAGEKESTEETLFVRIPEAARMMGIGRSSLYEEISSSRIRVRKAGRKTLIAVADIHAWFESLPEGLSK
jgi:excisionase family DNA binding protein